MSSVPYYGSEGGRIVRRDLVSGNLSERTHYIGSVEVMHQNGTRQFRRMIAGAAIATWYETTGITQVSYLHKDHLGSITAITNQSGQIVSRMGFDAWGKRRHAGAWNPWQAPPAQDLIAMLAITPRGYTGHEHVDAVGIVHMNGRIYDPNLGRMLQADPFVEDTGTLNRYSYVHNNPLAYTDPSGYFSVKQFLTTVVSIAIAVYTGVYVATLVKDALIAKAFFVSVAGGALAGAVSSGTVEGAAWGAFSAGVFFGIGQWIAGVDSFWNASKTALTASGIAAKTITHGIAGGTISKLQGGRFGHGFASAAGAAATAPLTDSERIVQGTIITSVVGGTLSKVSGGKFANGAVSAAMSYAFNQLASSSPDLKYGADEYLKAVKEGLFEGAPIIEGLSSNAEVAEAGRNANNLESSISDVSADPRYVAFLEKVGPATAKAALPAGVRDGEKFLALSINSAGEVVVLRVAIFRGQGGTVGPWGRGAGAIAHIHYEGLRQEPHGADHSSVKAAGISGFVLGYRGYPLWEVGLVNREPKIRQYVRGKPGIWKRYDGR